MKKFFRPLALFLALTFISQIFVLSSVAAKKRGLCGSGVSYSLNTDSGELVLSGSGQTYDFIRFNQKKTRSTDDEGGWSPTVKPGSGEAPNVQNVPWKEEANSIVSVTVGEKIKRVGNNAFSECYNIDKITFLSPDTEISSTAFDLYGSYTIYLYRDSVADNFFDSENYKKIYLDVKVDYEDGVIEEGAVLNTRVLDDETMGNFVISKENGERPEMVGYDIGFELDGVKVQPNGTVTIKIMVPENFNGKKCKVYHFSEDGTATDMDAEYIDGYMVFETDRFGYYVIADMSFLEYFEYGDANSDCKIDIRDAVLLAQYLAGWSVTVDEDAADCDADGDIDIRDAVLLAQHLAGWSVTLG